MGQINSSQQRRLFQEREVGRKQAVYPFKFIRRFFCWHCQPICQYGPQKNQTVWHVNRHFRFFYLLKSFLMEFISQTHCIRGRKTPFTFHILWTNCLLYGLKWNSFKEKDFMQHLYIVPVTRLPPQRNPLTDTETHPFNIIGHHLPILPSFPSSTIPPCLICCFWKSLTCYTAYVVWVAVVFS